MWSPKSTILPLLALSALPAGVLGGDILGTTGFSECMNNPTVKVTALNVQFNKATGQLVFDVAGENKISQKVNAEMVVSAYGKTIYTKSFDPCSLHMTEMCPVPAGTFSSSGEFPIPSQYASEIPAIAYTVPDLDGNVKLQLTNDAGQQVACIQSSVGNGHTLKMPVIQWVAAGIAVAALALSAISALSAGGHPGASTSSPTFTECVFWFQGIATNGMLSVNYPQVYQSFTTNFAFSTGLIQWPGLQKSIDGFRKATGGNLTDDNYEWLKNNATLVFTSDGTNSSSSKFRRALDTAVLFSRQSGTASVDGHSESIGGGSSNTTSSSSSKQNTFVSGITSYVEQLPIAKGNTFMTVLVIFAIVVAAIIVGVLLLKVILECWSMCGKLPKSLESWRKRYWWRMAKAITNLILILYGMWTLICIYQFTDGDDGSWGPRVLAAVTWSLFTIVLLGFTWRIWKKASEFKKLEGDASGLYEDKETWVKYSLFYDNFQKQYWMMFVPIIVYMFARGCVIAGANGHGLVQVAGQLIIESIMLILLLWTRPYERKSGKWINIVIHVVRVISVVCILVFVDQLGFGQTTQTITGVVLIVVQSVLTAVLAILIAVNALITCIKENPHRRARKEAEKANLNRDLDNLTPLDARNSLLMEPMVQQDTAYKGGMVSAVPTLPVFGDGKGRYNPVDQQRTDSPSGMPRQSRFDEHENLVGGAARMGMRDRSMSQRSVSPPRQQPRLPDLDFGYVNRR